MADAQVARNPSSCKLMADLGKALISKIVEEKDLVSALTAGIRISWFEDPEQRKVFAWVLEFFNRYGEVPTAQALNHQYPNFKLMRSREPYEYYLDEFRDLRKRAILVDAVIAADDALKVGDLRKAETQLAKGQLLLGLEVSQLTDVDLVDTWQERYRRYRRARNEIGKMRGIATGFDSLDFVTGGFQPQQFVLLGGTSKQGKSFLLMHMAVAAHSAGHNPLFVTFEMSEREQECRYDGITCRVNAQHLINGQPSGKELWRLKIGMRQRRHLEPFRITADVSASTTVSAIAAKVEQHRPGIVFIDGCYLMDNEIGADPYTTQAYTALSRSLKRFAQRVNLPIVGTTQALSSKMRGGEVTMHSLGWTSAWSQDADLILGVERTDPWILLRVVAGRNVSPCEIGVKYDWQTSQFDEVDLNEEDEENAEDSKQGGKPDEHRGRSRSARDRDEREERRKHRRSLSVSQR
jgi:hypothetical protein